MSTFQVNTKLDTVAANLHTGRDATGHISLRSAIMAANAHGGSDTIKLRTGTFTLTIAGAGENVAHTGDLDITSNLTIKGSGSGRTIIDGNHIDRVVEILHGQVKISGRLRTGRRGRQHGKGGNGGLARGDDSGLGSGGGNGIGGGLANFGTASFTGITIDFREYLATGGAGGHGGAGGTAFGGSGGGGLTGGTGFTATAGNGSDGGAGGRNLR